VAQRYTERAITAHVFRDMKLIIFYENPVGIERLGHEGANIRIRRIILFSK
jgi:hypothetical protein